MRGGTCVPAACSGSTEVIQGLGICFSDLVTLSTSTGAPLPTISGLTQPVPVTEKTKLTWWQILLMAFGCAFIFLVFVLLWRRKARRKRAQMTAKFARAKGMDNKRWWGSAWRLRVAKLFGRDKVTNEGEEFDVKSRLRDTEEMGDFEKMEERRWSGRSSVSKLSSVHDGNVGRRRDVSRSASVLSASGSGRLARQPVKEEPDGVGQLGSRNPFINIRS